MSYLSAVPDALAGFVYQDLSSGNVQSLGQQFQRQGQRLGQALRDGKPYAPENLNRIDPAMAFAIEATADPFNMVDLGKLAVLLPPAAYRVLRAKFGQGVDRNMADANRVSEALIQLIEDGRLDPTDFADPDLYDEALEAGLVPPGTPRPLPNLGAELEPNASIVAELTSRLDDIEGRLSSLAETRSALREMMSEDEASTLDALSTRLDELSDDEGRRLMDILPNDIRSSLIAYRGSKVTPEELAADMDADALDFVVTWDPKRPDFWSDVAEELLDTDRVEDYLELMNDLGDAFDAEGMEFTDDIIRQNLPRNALQRYDELLAQFDADPGRYTPEPGGNQMFGSEQTGLNVVPPPDDPDDLNHLDDLDDPGGVGRNRMNDLGRQVDPEDDPLNTDVGDIAGFSEQARALFHEEGAFDRFVQELGITTEEEFFQAVDERFSPDEAKELKQALLDGFWDPEVNAAMDDAIADIEIGGQPTMEDITALAEETGTDLSALNYTEAVDWYRAELMNQNLNTPLDFTGLAEDSVGGLMDVAYMDLANDSRGLMDDLSEAMNLPRAVFMRRLAETTDYDALARELIDQQVIDPGLDPQMVSRGLRDIGREIRGSLDEDTMNMMGFFDQQIRGVDAMGVPEQRFGDVLSLEDIDTIGNQMRDVSANLSMKGELEPDPGFQRLSGAMMQLFDSAEAGGVAKSDFINMVRSHLKPGNADRLLRELGLE